MEFTALNGAEISKIESTDGGIVFSTELQGIEANIEISGIVEIFKNGEMIELEDELQTLATSTIETVDLEVVSLEEDTFSEALIETEDGDTFQFIGEMKGTVLNMEDFEHLLDEQDEDDCCGCGCGCDGDCDEDCDCE